MLKFDGKNLEISARGRAQELEILGYFEYSYTSPERRWVSCQNYASSSL